jgi:dsDNA-specific endonuclease/ATPase MutS2
MIQSLKEREEKLANSAVIAVEEKHEEQSFEPVPVTFESLKQGDMVRIRSLNTIGQVIKKIGEKNKLLILAGIMKVEVRADDLESVRV